MRRSLFENTGGSFPELITRGDIKLFLPPIGGLTVYCFGDPAKLSDPNVRLALRVHDECNGSDVFGSDICTWYAHSENFRHCLVPDPERQDVVWEATPARTPDTYYLNPDPVNANSGMCLGMYL